MLPVIFFILHFDLESQVFCERPLSPTAMFAATIRYEAELLTDVIVVAASAPIGLRKKWPRVWCHHVRNIKNAMRQVLIYDSVIHVASCDTDLYFCIMHFRKAFQKVLDARNVKRKFHQNVCKTFYWTWLQVSKYPHIWLQDINWERHHWRIARIRYVTKGVWA